MNEKVDGRLLKQIVEVKHKKLAITVHKLATSNLVRIKNKLGKLKIPSVTYFDAQSEGSWIYNEQAGDQ